MKYNRFRRIVFKFEFTKCQFVFLPSFGVMNTKHNPYIKYKYSIGFIWLCFRFCFTFGRKKEFLDEFLNEKKRGMNK